MQATHKTTVALLWQMLLWTLHREHDQARAASTNNGSELRSDTSPGETKEARYLSLMHLINPDQVGRHGSDATSRACVPVVNGVGRYNIRTMTKDSMAMTDTKDPSHLSIAVPSVPFTQF